MSAMTAHRVKLSRAKGWRMPRDTVKVDRSTKWGNPFVVGRDGTRADCLRFYRALAMGYEVVSTHATHDEQMKARRQMSKAQTELRGKNLTCWCPLDKPCHADVLLDIVNGTQPFIEAIG